jgi:hypothetical protein
MLLLTTKSGLTVSVPIKTQLGDRVAVDFGLAELNVPRAFSRSSAPETC